VATTAINIHTTQLTQYDKTAISADQTQPFNASASPVNRCFAPGNQRDNDMAAAEFEQAGQRMLKAMPQRFMVLTLLLPHACFF
jgi:hypothetical protein